MARTPKKARRSRRREWTAQDERALRKHSRSKTRVTTVSREMKRTPGALRQKATSLGIPLGHQR
jgi:hypothetical protein